MEKLKTPLLVVFTLGVMFASYLPNLSTPFFHIDDYGLLVIPQVILPASLTWFKLLFTPGYHWDFYPIREISYWIDVNIFFPIFQNWIESANVICRIHQLLLFFGSGVGLYCLLIALDIHRTWALITVCLWQLNPYHYEMVWWISARKDMLAMFWFIWCSVAWLKYEKSSKNRWAIISLILFILSCLSKTSFLLAPVVLLVDLFFRKKTGRLVWPLVLATLFAVFWGLVQRWHYSNVVDLRFFYPWSYRFPVSMAALGRMALGIFNPSVNAIDIYNFGEWLSVNERFFGWGIAFFILASFFTVFSLFRPRWWIWTGLFWAAYLPISGLIFPHQNFYSVRYFEVTFLLLTIGTAFVFQSIAKKTSRFHKVLFIGSLFCWLSMGLYDEKEHWKSNIHVVKKAMRVTPGNIALIGWYSNELLSLAAMERPPGEITSLALRVRNDLGKRCVEKLNRPLPEVSTLCITSEAALEFNKTDSSLLGKQNLDLAAQHHAIAKRSSVEIEKKKQWADRVLILSEVSPIPEFPPYLFTVETRLKWLAAIRKIDPRSSQANQLEQEWTALGLFEQPKLLFVTPNYN